MTSDEARIVASICASADGGCLECAAQLVGELMRHWPEHRAAFAQVWREQFRYYPVPDCFAEPSVPTTPAPKGIES